MSNSYVKLVNSVARTKARVIQQSKQRRGGVTDLYALDYVSTFHTAKACAPYGNEEADGDDKDVQGRIKKLVKALKKEIPGTKPEGASAIVGFFGLESDVKAKRYENDYLTDYKYGLMEDEPTAEKLLGSWGAFASLYKNLTLDESGYLVDGKHWIGIGLGQWTGVRTKALYDFAKKDKRRSIFSFGTQIKFMLSEEGLANVVKEVASSDGDIEELTLRFLRDWGRQEGNKPAERVEFAKKHYEFIKNVLEGDGSGNTDNDKPDPEDVVPINKDQSSATFRVLVPSDLDRFQRWFLKFIVEQNKSGCDGGKVNPIADVHLTVSAKNEHTGETAEIDLTEIFRRQWGCNWIGDDASGEGIFPNNKPLEGYDLMYSAWYLNDLQRSALFSAGEKVFTVYALGEAKITLRNFLKYSHIN